MQCVTGCGQPATELIDSNGTLVEREDQRYCRDCLERAVRNGPKEGRPLGYPHHVKDPYFYQRKEYKRRYLQKKNQPH